MTNIDTPPNGDWLKSDALAEFAKAHSLPLVQVRTLAGLAEEAATVAINSLWEGFPEHCYEVAGEQVPDEAWDEFYLLAEQRLVAQFIDEFGGQE